MKFTLFATTLLTATLASGASLHKRYVVAPPGPTQGTAVENCNRWDYIATGTTCYDIFTKYGITLAELTSYNPFLTADCTNMWANYYICSGVAATTTSVATSAGPTSVMTTVAPVTSAGATGCAVSTVTVTVTA